MQMAFLIKICSGDRVSIYLLVGISKIVTE